MELMIAVLLLALLTSAAMLSFSGPIRLARAHEAVEQVRSFDASARDAARRSGHGVRIVFDLAAGTIGRREGPELETLQCQTTLPPGYRVTELRVAGQTLSDGLALIDVSMLGMSRSYAIHVTGQEFDQWMIIAGLSGEISQVQDERAMASLLDKAAPATYRPWANAAGNNAD